MVREGEFKTSLQKAEKQILESFNYHVKYEVFKSGSQSSREQPTMTSSLAEQLVLKDDFVVLDFKTEFSGRDLIGAKHKLRDIKPVFSEDVSHHRDV